MSKHLGKNVVIVLALVAAGFLAAWLRFRSHLGTEGTFTDGVNTYDVSDASSVRYAVWDRPLSVGGDVEGGEAARRPTVSPDGRYLVFAVGERGLGADLYLAELVEGKPVDPTPLTLLNSEADEWAPRFGDGALYFASDRVGGAGGLDLYRATYDRGVFAEPERLGGGINSDSHETDPAPLPGTGAILFSSDRTRAAIDHFDLFLAKPGEVAGQTWSIDALEACNTLFDERDPAFTADGRTLFFASDREDGAGGFDLYRSALAVDGWVPPVPLAGLNSAESERGPDPSRDGFSLLYGIESQPDADEATTRLVRARTLELFRTPGKPVGWRELLVLLVLLLVALLAWLAKRWEQLEVLYKCLLISLVVHLLLMWWFREVYPEGGEYDLEGESNRIRVRLVSNPSAAIARNSERGGNVEAARSETAQGAEAPTFEASGSRLTSEAAASAARMSRSAQAASSAPARFETQAPASTQVAAASRSLQSVQAPSESLQRFDGQAAEVQLSASAMNVAASRPSQTAGDQVARAETGQAAPASAAAPSEARLARAEGSADLSQAPGASAASELPSERANERSVAVATPAETIERLRGEASRMGLEAPQESTREAREAGSLARGEVPSDALANLAANTPATEAGSLPARSRGEQGLPSAPNASDQPARERPSLELPAVALSEAGRSEALERERLTADHRADLLADARPEFFQQSQGADPEWKPDTSAASAASDFELDGLAPASARALERSSRSAPDSAPTPQRLTSTTPSRERSELPTVALEHPSESADAESEARERLADDHRADLLADAAPVAFAGADREGDAGPGRVASNLTPIQTSMQARDFTGSLERPRREDASGPGRFEPAALAASSPARNQPEVELAGPMDQVAPLADSGVSRELADQAMQLSATSFERADRGSSAGPRQHDASALAGLGDSARPDFRPLEAGGPTRPIEDLGPTRLTQWEHTPYRSRTGSEKLRALELHGGDAKTEEAVAGGLGYLASRQRRGGFWGSPDDKVDKYRHVSIGKTGLALLAFMGASHTPESDTQYSGVTRKAVDFLLAVQDEGTGHFGDSGAYSHGVATYALAECYALTGEEALEEPLERAVAWILAKQMHSRDERIDGGWGYYYPDGEIVDRWPRASVTSWQVMALESARLGGLEVPDEAFADAKRFLANCWDEGRGAFRYAHDPSRLSGRYPILPGSTPATLFALSLLGEDIASRDYGKARTFVLERAPRRYRFTGTDPFVYEARGNLYFWYYATLALFRAGGRPWEQWNEAMKGTLLPAQEADGSWPAISIYATDFAGDDDDDRVYSTAMCVLTLEVYYRYFTPLLKVE